jgi:bacterioferritin-associated ferredoxin
MTQTLNPLKQYFRQPAVYIRLPSDGRFWPEGSLTMPETRELPVYPMTAIDEITYRTPDALFNGQAVVTVIESCMPNILNAWHVPTVDLNSILIAIRIASYGHELEISTTCPACDTVSDYGLDLRSVLDQLKLPDYASPLLQGDLTMTFASMDYAQQNSINLEQFDHQRMIAAVPDSDLPEDQKLQRMTEIMKNITDLTIRALVNSISSIRTPTATVVDREHIKEFLASCDRQVFGAIRDHVVKLRQATELRPVHMQCSNCQHEYDQQLNLDMTSFFGTAS